MKISQQLGYVVYKSHTWKQQTEDSKLYSITSRKYKVCKENNKKVLVCVLCVHQNSEGKALEINYLHFVLRYLLKLSFA